MTTKLDPVRYQKSRFMRSMLKKVAIATALTAALAVSYLVDARPVIRALSELAEFEPEAKAMDAISERNLRLYSACLLDASSDEVARDACARSSHDAFVLMVDAFRQPATTSEDDLRIRLMRAREAAVKENAHPYHQAVRRLSVACDEMFFPCPKMFGSGIKSVTLPDYYIALIDRHLGMLESSGEHSQVLAKTKVLSLEGVKTHE